MSSIKMKGTSKIVMVTVKKLSTLIAGAVISGFCLGLEPAHAHHGFLHTGPNGENAIDGLLEYQDSGFLKYRDTSREVEYAVFLSLPPSVGINALQPKVSKTYRFFRKWHE